MRILYSIGMCCYQAGIKTASLFGHIKAKQMKNGWRMVWPELEKLQLQKNDVAWFHASSLGEFEQARPVIEAFRKDHEGWKIVVTFFSPSGYEVRKNYPLADYTCYLPIDTAANARKFVKMVNPKKVFFVKYDFWFNYMREIKKCGAEMVIFSTIFRDNQYFFKWYGGWFLRQLKGFDHMFVQNEQSVTLLQNHGIERCSIAGDTRFDRVSDITKAAKRFPEIERFIGDSTVLMAGSSWEPDEENLYRYADKRQDSFKLIVAPHMIHEEHLTKIESLFGKERCVRYTQLTEQDSNKQILIIDTMGMLAAMYRYATVAYIGGGFGQGIHNILEALTFGKPVVFGPRYQKFKEARDIIEQGGGKSYTQKEELDSILDTWLADATEYQKASAICTHYVESNIGATKKILKCSC
ncbi:MAG: 3-deoxy-D-manno-octulosonic acid transferase [Bacteroidales bacterium]|nr:3-deoxy-D-manno-octulosonic acid transferase [Bacteroidales bacterium]